MREKWSTSSSEQEILGTVLVELDLLERRQQVRIAGVPVIERQCGGPQVSTKAKRDDAEVALSGRGGAVPPKHSESQAAPLSLFLKKVGRGWHGRAVELEPTLGFGNCLVQCP